MMKNQIENDLRSWLSFMSNKYCWLRSRFEYSEARGRWLVSFSPVDRILLSDAFNNEAIAFADKMNDEYGNQAPLFTDEEQLFGLTANAESIAKELVFYTETVMKYSSLLSSISFYPSAQTVSKMNTKCDLSQSYNLYAVAA